jgi:hypothetical protein
MWTVFGYQQGLNALYTKKAVGNQSFKGVFRNNRIIKFGQSLARQTWLHHMQPA